VARARARADYELTTKRQNRKTNLGIDRFLSMFRALVNMIGNGVATVVLARWEGELEGET
jgi:hypothetical protein